MKGVNIKTKSIVPPFYGEGEDNYIYGRLFKSWLNNGGFVIDIGDVEYPVTKAEVWNGEKYVHFDDLEGTISQGFYGGFARINKNDF